MSLLKKLAQNISTPYEVQKHILSMPYNREENGETIRSAEEALKHNTGHCLEMSFVAAAVLEQHGYPPYILSLESKDLIDHVVFIFQENGYWGSIGRSREAGLQGRRPIYRTVRDLMWSYYDPYVDDSGRLIGYQVFHLDETQADWRSSKNHLWRIQIFLCEEKHIRLNSSDSRYKRLMTNYLKRGPIDNDSVWWY